MAELSPLAAGLTPRELSDIVRAHFGNTPFAFGVLPGGACCACGLLRLADGRCFLLRAGPADTSRLLPFEARLTDAVPAFTRLCREAGIPAPQLAACVTDKKRMGRTYVLMEYVEGVRLSDASIPPEAAERLCAEADGIAARLHAVRGGGFGRLSDAADGRGFSSWRTFLAFEFDEIARCLKRYDAFTLSELEGLRALPDRCAAVLDSVTEPLLVHGSLRRDSFLVSPDYSRIAALTGGAWSFFGDCACEPGGDWTRGGLLSRGRLASPPEPACALRHTLYTLWRTLIDVHARRAEFPDPDGFARAKERALSLLARLSRSL